MKKISILCAALAAMTLCSCNKESVSSADGGKKVMVTVKVSSGLVTKATGLDFSSMRGDVREYQIGSADIFVFNEGQLEAHESVSGASPDGSVSAVLAASSGQRNVWAVVNAPSLGEIASESQLKAALSSLRDNSLGSFIMSGSVTAELTDGGTVPVQVKRIVSRVSINKISTNFPAGSYRENYSINVKGIYLINVAGNNNYEVSAQPSLWVNQLGHKDADFDGLLYDSLSGVSVKNGSPYEVEHVFYPYPNTYGTTSTTNYEDTWSPRGTMLVISVDMLREDNSLYMSGYYPIALPAIERNKCYIIDEVSITRVPGDSEYKPIETGDATVSITVLDWETGSNLGSINI